MYARARPPLPAEAADWLVDGLGLAAEASCLELGAGTGNLTRLLAARSIRVLAVEPVAEMRAGLAGLGRLVQPVDAVAEALPLAGASVRAAIASQSLHWCDVPRVLAELARVLTPDGRLGLVWNLRRTDDPLGQALDTLLAGRRRGVPHSRDGRWQQAVAASAFGIEGRRRWAWVHETTVRGVLEYVASVSYVAALPDGERETVLAATRELLPDGADTAVAMRFETAAYVLCRT